MSPPPTTAIRAKARRLPTARQVVAIPRELIRVEHIAKTYRQGELDVSVLKGVSFTIARGEMIALMGASGSGKTTLMNILGCLDRPSSGRYWLDGQDMGRLAPDDRALVRTAKLGFVFQNFNLLPRTSALQNVLMPLDYSVRRPDRGDARRLAESLLKQVGLASRMGHEPSQMSGGQQQRVAIARALVNRPALLLADEPTGNLDSRTGDEILRLFQRLCDRGITVILVTHDAKVAAYADRTLRIADGLLADDAGRPGEGSYPCRAALAGKLLEAAPPLGSARGPESLYQSLSEVHLGDGAALSADNEAQEPALIVPPPARGRRSTAGAAEEGGHHANAESPPVRPGMFAAAALFAHTLRTAAGNLRRNTMRSALTALGVIIGVAAVIAMTEIGEGSRATIEKTIASMGAYKLPVFPAAANNGGVNQGTGTFQTLKPSDADAIARECPAVTEVAPVVWTRAQVVYGSLNWVPQQLSGVTPSYLATRDWEDLAEGTCFTDEDVRASRAVCLIGATIRRVLFDDGSPIDKMIRIHNVRFRVIGLLSRRGANMTGQDQDDCILAPWTTIKFRLNSVGAGLAQPAAALAAATVNTLSIPYATPTPLYPQTTPVELVDRPQSIRQTSVDYIQARAANAEQVPAAIEQIAAVLRERHHLREDQNDDFKILNVAEIAHAAAQTSELMGSLLLIVAAISLAVGGVGIMNIMLVSVTERTREIGLRMAVGARRHHILLQFLLEAVLLCLAGGGLGILAGRGASILVRRFEHWPTGVSLPAIVISVVAAAGVGVVFGFYPAWQASRLDPIEALRHE